MTDAPPDTAKAIERVRSAKRGQLIKLLLGIEHIGYIIREARYPAGLRETAKQIGISPTTLSRIENGHDISSGVLVKIRDWAMQNQGGRSDD